MKNRKKGTRVRIESGGKSYWGVYDGRIGVIIEESTSVLYVLLDSGVVTYINVKHLEETEPSIDNLMPGDVLVDRAGDEARVLAVVGDVFLKSIWGDYEKSGSWYTKCEARKNLWKLKGRKDDVVGSIVEVVVDGTAYDAEVKGLRK